VNQGEDGKYKFIPAAEPEVDYVVYDKVSYSYLNAPKNFYVQTETGYELAEFLFSAAYLNAMSASGKTVRRAVFTANTAIFDPAAVYFVLVDGKYTVADIEAFEAGITYYTITSFGPAIVAGTAFDRNAVYALYGTAEESYTLTELSPFDVIGDAEAVFYVARLNLNGAIYLTKTGLSATVYAKPGEDFAADKSYFAYSAEFGAYFLVPASKLFVKVEAGEPYSEHIRYYTFDAAAKSYKLAEIAAFEAGKTYYRGSFTALSADAAFNPLKNYFTYNEAGYYEYAAISAFDPEVTYYLINDYTEYLEAGRLMRSFEISDLLYANWNAVEIALELLDKVSDEEFKPIAGIYLANGTLYIDGTGIFDGAPVAYVPDFVDKITNVIVPEDTTTTSDGGTSGNLAQAVVRDAVIALMISDPEIQLSVTREFIAVLLSLLMPELGDVVSVFDSMALYLEVGKE
ncbi:MAG TPA: hypothetical protein PK245_02580, partial [Clostridia bacterium]|nr:hypothetical protein [Clostridia bacterium]